MGTPDVRAAAAGAGAGRPRGGGRGRLGDRRVRRAAIRRRLQRAEQPEPAGERPGRADVRPEHGRRGGPLHQPQSDRARRRVPDRGHPDAGRAAQRRGADRRDLLDDQVATVRRGRRPCYLRSFAAVRRFRLGPAEHVRRDPGQAGRPRADQPGRRAGADLLGDQQGRQVRHRPGRGHLPAGAAGPAAGDLRQPGCGQPAAGHRGHRHPRLVRRAAVAHPGHRGVHLLDQHHHDPRPGPRHRLRPVHGQPVPRGTAPAAQHRGRGGAHSGHRGPHHRGVRGHRGRGAGRADAVPRDVPALDGLRRGGHRAGGHAGRAHRPARAAGRARPPGQRAAGAPRRGRAAPGRAERRLVPAGPRRDAPARPCTPW